MLVMIEVCNSTQTFATSLRESVNYTGNIFGLFLLAISSNLHYRKTGFAGCNIACNHY